MSREQRAAMTHAVLVVLSRWRLERADQLTLLGLPEGTRPRLLKRFQEGEPLPSDPAVTQRVECLLQIDQALVSLFPQNPVLADLWVTTPSPQYANCAPVATMLEEGLPAMQALLAQLNGTGDDW